MAVSNTWPSHIPNYEYGRGSQNPNLQVPIPPFTGVVNVPSPPRILLEVYVRTLSEPWIGGKPGRKRTQLIKDLILKCYHYAFSYEKDNSEKSVSGHFKLADISVEDGEATINCFHVSNKGLGLSLEQPLAEILNIPKEIMGARKEHASLFSFLTTAKASITSRDLATLYFCPILRTTMENGQFLLDIPLIISPKHRGNRELLKKYKEDVNKTFWSNELSNLLNGRFNVTGDTLKSALLCAEFVAHHYNEYVGTSLSFEAVMEIFFKAFPTLPERVCNAVKKQWDFRNLIEDLKIEYA